MYYLERRAIKAFNTRYPAGYNLDAGGLIPEHHPMSVEKNVASNATRLQRERAEFRADYGISKAQFSTTSASNRVVQEGGWLPISLTSTTARRAKVIPPAPGRYFRAVTSPRVEPGRLLPVVRRRNNTKALVRSAQFGTRECRRRIVWVA